MGDGNNDWEFESFESIPDDINKWINPESGYEPRPTSVLQHVCYYDGRAGSKFIFDQIISNADLDVNYESIDDDGEYYGTTAFVYIIQGAIMNDQMDMPTVWMVEKFEMLKALVAREDFNINKPVCSIDCECEEYMTPLTWFLDVGADAFEGHVSVAECIEAIVAHPYIEPTADEIDRCAEYGVVVLPRPIRNLKCNLNKWRKACRCLLIYQFWWKVAGEGQHAPGGRGEKRSREEFDTDFAGSRWMAAATT